MLVKRGSIVRRLKILLIIYALALSLVDNPWTMKYISTLKTTETDHDELRLKIIASAKKYHIPPQNAMIDKVWKATPGYNGLEVDIDASYEKMKLSGTFNEKNLVFRQRAPSIHLNDLENKPIYRGNSHKKMVTLIINVAWGNEYIPSILATLKKYSVTATFFIEGKWAKNYPNVVKMIVDAGHEIGNHSYNHPDMSTLSNQKIAEEIRKTNDVLEATTNQKISWFAPPSGSYNQAVVDIAKSYQLGTIMWSIDTLDWQKPTPSVIVERVTSKLHNGAMILMHPTIQTAKALDPLLKNIRRKGYEIDSVTTLLDEERVGK